jgi:hypothetical protein
VGPEKKTEKGQKERKDKGTKREELRFVAY